jgi:hypothetical protein
LGAISERNLKKSLGVVERYAAEGGNVRDLIDEMLLKLKKDIFKPEAVGLMEVLIEARIRTLTSLVQELPLEIGIVKWIGQKNDPPSQDLNATARRGKVGVAQACVTKEAWAMVTEKVRKENFSVDALLRAARPMDFDGDNLNIGVYYQFHKERLEDNQNRMFLEDILGEVFGFPVKINCSVTGKPKGPVLTDAKDEDIIKVAEEIFSK